QYGYVSTADAHELDIPVVELGKLAHRGRLEQVAYGIYRFPELPAGEYGPYLLATLWAGRRGVLSHETVLALHDLGDLNPTSIHLTVPVGYRPRRRGGQLYTVHQQDLEEADLGWFEGIRTVTPRVAIVQCISDGTATYLTRQATEMARGRGLLTADERDHLTGLLEDATHA
ncbi:MAG: type IV toxin-antitoxin system AbiEi family antitoxin domain-containing protein, partial [Nitriliruptor sp.]